MAWREKVFIKKYRHDVSHHGKPPQEDLSVEANSRQLNVAALDHVAPGPLIVRSSDRFASGAFHHFGLLGRGFLGGQGSWGAANALEGGVCLIVPFCTKKTKKNEVFGVLEKK